ncbi:MAG TPA: hypothetical protein VGD37_34295, partial [Kofleriaceae bacterium]
MAGRRAAWSLAVACLVPVFVSLGCGSAPAPRPPRPEAKPPQPAAGFAPRADHHQHLLSPAAARRVNQTLPLIELPLELARVLRDHEARWTDAAGLAPLYTSDAMVRTSDRRGWVRGRA